MISSEIEPVRALCATPRICPIRHCPISCGFLEQVGGMAERHDPYVSLRNPNFLWYVASLVAVTLGTQIQATVVGWQVYALTKDPLSLGMVGLAEALPFIGAALYAGHIADRHNRKTLALIALGIQGLCGVALLILTLRADYFLAGRV